MALKNISAEVGRPSFEIGYYDLMSLSADDLKEKLLTLADDGGYDVTVSFKICAAPDAVSTLEKRPEGDPLVGGLYIHCEQGIDGYWALQEGWQNESWDYEHLHSVSVGDFLEVVELKSNEVVWAGRIANWRQGYGNQSNAYGSYAPRNVDEKTWESFFPWSSKITHMGRLWKARKS